MTNRSVQRAPTRRVLLAGAAATALALAYGAPAAAQLLRDPQRDVLTFAGALRSALPAVVRVLNYGGPDTADMAQPDGRTGQPDGRRGQAEAPQAEARGARQRRPSGTGSGVIIDAAEGLLLTNHHVVNGAAEVRVGLPDGRDLAAEVLGSDEESDIALLRVAPDNLVAVARGDSRGLQLGDLVFAVGHPFGLPQTVTMGIVSGVERRVGRVAGTRFIQTDAAINAGNSGGPLLDSNGRLIGINTLIFTGRGGSGGGNIGIGWASPAHIALLVAEQLRAFGEVRRGRLGVETRDVTPELGSALKLALGHGALITRVEQGGLGEQIGLRNGDLVTEAGSARVEDGADLRAAIGLATPGSVLPLVVLRGTERLELVARVEAPPEAASGPRLAGAQFALLDRNHPMARFTRGVAVGQVRPGSEAARQGLRAGDVVTHVNRTPVASPAELARLLDGLRDLAALSVARGNSELIVVLRSE